MRLSLQTANDCAICFILFHACVKKRLERFGKGGSWGGGVGEALSAKASPSCPRYTSQFYLRHPLVTDETNFLPVVHPSSKLCIRLSRNGTGYYLHFIRVI